MSWSKTSATPLKWPSGAPSRCAAQALCTTLAVPRLHSTTATLSLARSFGECCLCSAAAIAQRQRLPWPAGCQLPPDCRYQLPIATPGPVPHAEHVQEWPERQCCGQVLFWPNRLAQHPAGHACCGVQLHSLLPICEKRFFLVSRHCSALSLLMAVQACNCIGQGRELRTQVMPLPGNFGQSPTHALLLPPPQKNAACYERDDIEKAYGFDFPRPTDTVCGLGAAMLFPWSYDVHNLQGWAPLASGLFASHD